MSEPLSRGLAWILPGAHRIVDGRWGTGSFALAAWLLCLGTAVSRWDRVSRLGSGGPAEWLAALTLVAVPAAILAWSVRDRGRPRPEHPGQWVLAARAFGKDPLAVLGLGTIGLLYLVALLTPLLAPHDPNLQEVAVRYQGPGAEHLLGTDQFGRDVLSRIMFGARVSLSIGFIAVGISVTIGTLVGAMAGYLGGRTDAVIMRTVDTIISFPRLVLLITLVAVFEPSIFVIVAVLGLTQWPYISRIVRGEVLSLREREFVQAARALGFTRRRIVLRHLIPNALAPLIVAATLGIGNTIVLEAGLSFLGIGIQPPDASWGNMVQDGRNQLLGAWWISTFSGFAIVVTVLAFNLAGDGLRDALDPRLRAE